MSDHSQGEGLKLLYSPPAMERVTGFFAYGDGELFPSDCGLDINEFPTEEGVYEATVLLTPPYNRMVTGVEALAFCQEIFDALNLPKIEEMEQCECIECQLAPDAFQHKRETDVVFELGRAQFEELCARVASSSYTQLSEHPDVAFVLDMPRDAEEREELLAIYHWKFREEAKRRDDATLDIRPMVDRKGDLAGLLVPEPFLYFFLRDIPYCEPDGNFSESTGWPGW